MNTVETWQISSSSSASTEQLGRSIGARLKGGEVIELASDLGGGKTTFVRGLAAGMGSQDAVSSPSFTISNVYECIRDTTGAQLLHSSGVQGAAEQRTEPYTKYGERAAEAATPRSAESTGRVSGYAQKQDSAVQRLWLHHYDFYRLPDAGLMQQELAEVLDDPKAVVVVEWAGAVENVLPAERVSITIKTIDENEREFDIGLPERFGYLRGEM